MFIKHLIGDTLTSGHFDILVSRIYNCLTAFTLFGDELKGNIRLLSRNAKTGAVFSLHARLR